MSKKMSEQVWKNDSAFTWQEREYLRGEWGADSRKRKQHFRSLMKVVSVLHYNGTASGSREDRCRHGGKWSLCSRRWKAFILKHESRCLRLLRWKKSHCPLINWSILSKRCWKTKILPRQGKQEGKYKLRAMLRTWVTS